MERSKNLTRKDEEERTGWEKRVEEVAKREILIEEEGGECWRKSRSKVGEEEEKVKLRAEEENLSKSSREGAGCLSRR